MDDADCTTMDNGNSTPKCHAPNVLSLPPKNSQEVPAQTITVAPLGVPTTIIFPHCQLSVEKSMRGGKDLPHTHTLAGMPPVGLKSDRGNWTFPDELYSPVVSQFRSSKLYLANHGWRKIDLQSHMCKENVLFFRALMLFMLFLAATTTGN